MYIRCADCMASSWIPSLSPGEAAARASCQSCGRSYELHPVAELGQTAREHYRTATQFAAENAVDLPGAYSVLLGIMHLDQARLAAELPPDDEQPLAEPAPPPRQPPPREASAPPRERLPFDAGFTQAVSEGCLTVQQAIERGDRKAWARRISARHGLPMEQALRIADNRENLHSAILAKPPTRPLRSAPPARGLPRRVKAASHSQKVLIVILGLVAVGAIGLHSWRLWDTWVMRSLRVTQNPARPPGPPSAAAEPETPAGAELETEAAPPPGDGPHAAALERVEVSRDERGEVVRVAGPDPRTVLSGYCAAGKTSVLLEPLEVLPTVPPMTGSRLGVFRDFGDLSSLFAIRIQKDRKTRRWVAGDGRRPIVHRRAPDLPPEAPRLPAADR